MRKITAKRALFLIFLVSILFSASPSIYTSENYFSYKKNLPLNAEVKTIDDPSTKDAPFAQYHVWYDSVNGARVPGILTIPKVTDKNKTAGPPWPVIFLMHYHASDKSLFNPIIPIYASVGFATFAIDGIYRGERKAEDKDILDPDTEVTLNNMKQQVFDIMRGFDFLAAQKDIDIKRLGYLGISMGAFTGAVATANDERVKAVVLALAGGDLAKFFKESTYGDVKKITEEIKKRNLTEVQLKNLMEKMKIVDPLEYAPKFKGRHVLMLNGKKDTVVPKACVDALYNAIPGPKDIKWHRYNLGGKEGGHVLLPNDIIALIKWYAANLPGEEQKKEGDTK